MRVGHRRPAVMFGRWIAADGVLGSIRVHVRVRSSPHPPRAQPLWRASKTAAKSHLRSTGADTRLSSNHGSNERSPLRRNFQPRRWRTAVCAKWSLWTKWRQIRGRGAPSRPIDAVTAPLVHGWLEKRSQLRAGGSSLEFRRSPVDRGPAELDARRRARGRGPAELEAGRRRRARGATHTRKTTRAPIPHPFHHRSSRTASSPSRTPRSAASARF